MAGAPEAVVAVAGVVVEDEPVEADGVAEVEELDAGVAEAVLLADADVAALELDEELVPVGCCATATAAMPKVIAKTPAV
ncbi:MAG: hypothetical protein U0271_18565 [Polyangiaceae bacterium]